MLTGIRGPRTSRGVWLSALLSMVYVLLVPGSHLQSVSRTEARGKALQTAATSTQTSIRGTLRDSNGPIGDADIYLQYFNDEKCAKLFARRDYNPADEKAMDRAAGQLRKCSYDLPRTKPDGQGHYQFDGLKPGWYAMRFLWNIHDKPKESTAYSERNGFIIGYYVWKDLQEKYDSMAQGMPVYYSGKEEVVIDFDATGRELK
jgi:hypothetical protein